MSDSKNDIAWNALFEKHHILEKIEQEGYFKIKSSDINKYREARLMTKFDFSSQLPTIFKENDLSLLPISRNSYLIAAMQAFHTFEKQPVQAERIVFPENIQSIKIEEISSEAVAVNAAFLSGILEKFLEESPLNFTVNGRMGSETFDFTIDANGTSLAIHIQNAQIEIDAGLEGPDSLTLIEAKNSLSDDFLIRQLYFPFRLWSDKIKKKVRPVFMTYTNGIFYLREYAFEPKSHYNAIKLVQAKRYSIQEGVIGDEELKQILRTTQTVMEPEIPFPQADSFDRLINLLEFLYQEELMTLEDITSTYDFDQRQSRYYTSAGMYLGLIYKEKESHAFGLTERGKKLFKESIFNRQLSLIRCVMEHVVFHRCLSLYLKEGNINKEAVVKIMKEESLYNINSENTYFRRAATIIKWLEWMKGRV
jgi:hypothetical protein